MPSSKQQDKQSRDAKCHTIYLVEEDPTQANFLSVYLKRVGYQVMIADGGERCFLEIVTCCPAVIVLSIGLPISNSIDLLTSIKSHQVLREVPVIVMSYIDDFNMIKLSFSLGAQKYFIKDSVSPAEIAIAIKKLLPD